MAEIARKQEAEKKKQELMLTLQFMILIAFNYCTNLTWFLVPLFTDALAWVLLIPTFVVLNAVVNPTVNFAFNRQLREAMVKMVGGKECSETKVVVLTTKQQTTKF